MRNDGRLDGWTVRASLLAAVLLKVYPSNRLSAQAEVHLSAGARYTSTLVADSIVAPFDVRPAVAPAFAVALLERTRGPWMPEVTLDLSWSALERHDAGGAATRITSLTTVAFTVGLRRQVLPGLAARLGVGGLKYFPGDETGIFKDGAGIAALGSGALDYAPPFAARHRLALTARYDLHRFITPALRSVGFIDARVVHRVAIGVAIGLGRKRSETS